MTKFRVGLTRDLMDASGKPSFGEETLQALGKDPRIAWEVLATDVKEITPAEIATYDALYIGMPRVTPASFTGNVQRTRIIARHGVGFDTVDVGACTAHGVILTIQPDGVRRPMAVVALTYVFALSQKLLIKDRLTRAGRWAEKVGHMGRGLIGRTLGVIGAGNIGSEIIRLAQPFGLTVLADDPFVDAAKIEAAGARAVDLKTLLRESDFVVVMCQLTKETRHLIGAAELALMKPDAYLISIARGPIVDEAALIAALRAGRIAGAGIDVFEQEPVDPANPLLTMENVIVTPHALCWTDQCFSGIAESGFNGIRAVFSGKAPRGVVNRDVLEDRGLKEWLQANATAGSG
ncbi:MAG: NAD(P)-dependent oxidoreductase [Acetobacteraceae bacterium]